MLLTFPILSFSATSKWGENEYSRARIRLVGLEEDKLTAILEMQLNDGWHTYYKDPGDLGMPTAISNLSGASMELRWPQYSTIKKVILGNELYSNVYYQSMIVLMELLLPIKKVAIALDYAVCKDYCVPLKMELSVDVPVDHNFGDNNKKFLEQLSSVTLKNEKYNSKNKE